LVKKTLVWRSSLDDLAGLIDWSRVACQAADVSSAAKGEPARGSTPRVVATSLWGRDEAATIARLEAWNRPIHHIRARLEKFLGTWKRSCGLGRMRWRGLAKAAAQVRLTAIAYNLERTLCIVVRAA
jgi:hypothetical protein